MKDVLPRSVSRPNHTPDGEALSLSNRWQGGQYCAIPTNAGLFGCGIYDLAVADEFHIAFALAKGTPEKMLIEPEDLLSARIDKVSGRARSLDIQEGMSGAEALRVLLAESRQI